jgi:DNA mismatch endonuclease (patch repair protein)
MVDNMTREQRSRTMSRIRSRDTAAELALRRILHRRGLRYRIHVRSLPGSPDIVFPRQKVAVFVDGDFWHGRTFAEQNHRWSEYWRAKIARNMDRDRAASAGLRTAGWTVLRIWEHEVRADPEECADRVEEVVRPRPPSEE